MPLLFAIVAVASAFFVGIALQDIIDTYGGTEIKSRKYIEQTTTHEVKLPVRPYPVIEDLNGQLMRLCQLGQAMIIRCQECYLSGETNCPYPTNEFCESAKGADYNDPNLVWGFLPDPTGDLSVIWDYDDPSCNIENDEDLKTLNCLPQYIRWKARRVLDKNLVEKFEIRYRRPAEKESSDVCAVDGVITDITPKE